MEISEMRGRCWKCLGSLVKKENGLVRWISLSRLEISSTGKVFLSELGHILSLTPGHRGDDTIKLFSYMDKLRDQALAAGGMVLSHLGNHEWMNVIGMISEFQDPP